MQFQIDHSPILPKSTNQSFTTLISKNESHVPFFGRLPIFHRCIYCQKEGFSEIKYRNGLAVFILCILFLPFLMCLVPFFCKCFKDVHHFCRNPECKKKILVDKRC